MHHQQPYVLIQRSSSRYGWWEKEKTKMLSWK